MKLSENVVDKEESNVLKKEVWSKKKKRNLKPMKPVSLKNVKCLILAVLRKVILQNSFGNQFELIVKQLLRVLKYGKNQVFQLHDLLMNIEIKKIKFLRSIKNMKSKWNLLAKFLLWLLTKYIFKILAIHFYITETRDTFHKLNYYRKKDWKMLKYSLLSIFENQGKWKLIKRLDGIQKHLSLGTCRVRFIPKGKFGARPIVWRKWLVNTVNLFSYF